MKFSLSASLLTVALASSGVFAAGYQVPDNTTCVTPIPDPCSAPVSVATPTPAPSNGRFYPEFFDFKNYGTPSHFFDGAVGECYGTDGTVNVMSIKMASSSGGDAFLHPSSAKIKLAFYPAGGCSGDIIGIVPVNGQVPSVNLSTIPKSVRFFDYSMDDAVITAKSTKSNSSSNAAVVAVGGLSFIASLTSFLL